jgi:4-hydroxy-tetrahydrodipicolinate reductase
MRIGVVGQSGRMSRAVLLEIEKNPDCYISGALVRKKNEPSDIPEFQNILDLAAVSDAIIDFSNPATSIEIAEKLANNKITLVCGTTGFSEEEFAKLNKAAEKVTIIYSPNFSIGINLIQNILKQISPVLTDFDAAIIDIHHKHKKDSPSGTTKLLASSLSQNPQISSLRIGEVPGEHQVIFSSDDEEIKITHQAFNRNVFAKGAIRAALWGKDKRPSKLYSMEDAIIEKQI